MKRVIECTDSYNPYIILEKIDDVLQKHSFILNTEHYPEINDNYIRHTYISGNVKISISTNYGSDMHFQIKMDDADEMRPFFEKINMDFRPKDTLPKFILYIKSSLTLHKDSLSDSTLRAMKINELLA